MMTGSKSQDTSSLLNLEDFDAFLKDYQKSKDTLSYNDLRVKVLQGPNKGKSGLWWLAKAAQNGQVAFREVWNKFKNQITLDDLRTKAEEGDDKGKSVLWLLILVKHSNIIQAIWDKFKDQITLDDLRVKAEEGPDKGKSVLWQFVARINMQVLNLVCEKFNNDLTIDDLRARAEIGPDKGKSVLWLLTVAVTNGNPQALQAVLHKFQNQITFDDFRVKAVNGSYKGKSAFWMLAVALSNGRSDLFQVVWEKFQDQITLDDLRVKAENGEDKGISVMWAIAATAAHVDHHPIFQSVWAKFQNHMTLDDLRAKNNNVSPLCMLTMRAQPLKLIWDQFKNDITLDDLRYQATEGGYIGASMLMNIVRGAFQRQINSSQEIFREILTQMPFVLNDEELVEKNEDTHHNFSIAEMIQATEDVSWREFSQNLITARNILFKAIKRQQENDFIEETDIQALSEFAKAATTAGYLNAFYDIGILFLEKKNPLAASLAFQELPPHAKQFTIPQPITVRSLLENALIEKNDQIREKHLEAALWFALRLDNNGEKKRLLQQIADCHVTKGNSTHLEALNFINESVLACINEHSSPKHCLRLFEVQYRLAKLEAAQQQSIKKQEEQSFPMKSASHYMPYFNASSQAPALPQEMASRSRKTEPSRKQSSKRSRE